MISHPAETWISIAAQVSIETDATKLAHLVQQLCCSLDNRIPTASENEDCGVLPIMS